MGIHRYNGRKSQEGCKEVGRRGGRKEEKQKGRDKAHHSVFCDSILSSPCSPYQLAKFNPFVKDAKKALLMILILLEFDELDCHLQHNLFSQIIKM